MRIISSKTLRNDYAGVTAEARESGEPIFVTKNGAEDIVLMSHDAYLEREAALNERAAILEAEAEYLRTGKSYSLPEVRSMLAAGRSASVVA